MLVIDKIICDDCLDVMREMPDGCVDLVIADPPYGMGIDTWDIKQDISAFTKEAKRVLNPQGFYAFFGQMPYILDWCNEASKEFKYTEHITWVKRMVVPSYRIARLHEEILIYSLDNGIFYETRGPYEDVKVPGILFDIITVQGIMRYISELHLNIDGKKRSKRSGMPRCKIYERFKSITEIGHRNSNYTNVWSFLPGNKTYFNKEKPEHPTIKSLVLMERLIEMLTLPDMLVLSPFLGSGTDAVACINTGRHYIGMELSPEYCAIAETRISQAEADKAERDRQMEMF